VVLVAFGVLAVAGCGSGTTAAKKPPPPNATPSTTAPTTVPAPALRVGVVGPLTVKAPSAVVERGPLGRVAGNALVLVSAATVGPQELAAFAEAHPASRFALIGASTKGFRRPNLVGVRFREDQAALLAGSVAGLTARAASPNAPSVAWVGSREPALVRAFVRGVQSTAPGAVVLREWSRDAPLYCKEAAIAAIQGGALVVAAHDGLCAEGAANAAHEQGEAAVAVSSFELPGVAAGLIVKEALAGVHYGGEDLILGAASGAIGVGRLDPAIPPSVVVQAHIAAQQLAVGGGASG